MPKIPTAHDLEIAAMRAAWAEFEQPSAWRLSQRGNLWRRWDGEVVTIYRRHGGYQWCIAGDDGKRFSKRGYETEADAITAAGEAIGVFTG
jgi:hypothetical protein